MAIGAVAYLSVVNYEGQCHIGSTMGKSKVTPKPAYTKPWLELCAAVELYELVRDDSDIKVDAVKLFTDFKITIILHAQYHQKTHPGQWHYITTKDNPAENGTRPSCL